MESKLENSKDGTHAADDRGVFVHHAEAVWNQRDPYG